MNLRMIERWVWYAFVATAAWQTRLIFWQADRTFIEWRSASLYFSDVLMLLLFAFVVFELVRARDGLSLGVGGGTGPAWGRLERLSLVVFFFFSAISLLNANSVSVGVYALVRLAQFIALYFYLRYWALSRFDLKNSAIAFLAGALVQAGIGITQFMLQRDIGLRWLGETLLRTNMQGVAVFYDMAHDKILRAYGTLPHPNVLAAYLMAALWATWWLWRKNIKNIWYLCVTIVLLWAFYLTFSRTVIALWAVASAIMLIRWRACLSGRQAAHIIGTVAIVSLVFAAVFWPQVQARLLLSSSDEAVQLRIDYAQDSLYSGGGRFLNVNWFGIGIGNFTTWLAHVQPKLPAYYIQPAHNVFLLLYSEIGLFGLLAFLVWVATVAYAARRSDMLIVIAAFVCIALFDHFFWTLQQGRILWWAVMALAAGIPLARIQAHGRPH